MLCSYKFIVLFDYKFILLCSYKFILLQREDLPISLPDYIPV